MSASSSSGSDYTSLPVAQERALAFGRYRVLPGRRELLADGKPIEIGGRAFDLLVVLLEAHGTIIAKDRIIGRVWPDVHVEDANLRVQMNALRKALGDDRNLIKTIPGRGYLLAAEVAHGTSPAVEMPMETISSAEPAVGSYHGSPTNLRRWLNSLIGRHAELDDLRDLTNRSRLITLTGSGGVGKTRLAMELGRQVQAMFPHGVSLIDLAPLRDPTMIAAAAATALGMVMPGDKPSAAAIAAALTDQKRLLILDNCEHLVPATRAFVRVLLDRASDISVLVTSQESLGVEGEQTYRLDPLAIPCDDAAEIADFDAIRLFVERAAAVDRRFALGPANATAVAEICRRLDGVPLALEMAAARVPLLGIDRLRDGLDQRLRMLQATPHAGELRYRTLGAVLDWSYGLLTNEEQRGLRRLAVFVGSFSLDAAVAIMRTEDADEWDTTDLLGRLVDKSLVSVEADDSLRYRLLETLRFFAVDRLRESGESEAIRARHAEYFAGALVKASDVWESTADDDWIGAYGPLIGDARAALDWSMAEPARTELSIALVSSINLLLLNLGLNGEGLRLCDLGLRLVGPTTPPLLAARFFRVAAWYAMDLETALEFGRRAAGCFREADDPFSEAAVIASIGGHLTFLGRFREAKEVLERAQTTLAGSAYCRSLATALDHSGLLASLTGDSLKARQFYDEALALAQKRRLSDVEHNIMMHSAALEFRLGDLDAAIERARQVASRMKPGYPRPPHVWPTLGSYLALRGDLSEARTLAERFLPVAKESVETLVRVCLSLWGFLCAAEGQHEDAARMAGFVEAGLAKSGAEHVLPVRRAIDDRVREMIEKRLDAARLQTLKAEGARWSRTEAVAFAREQSATRPEFR